MISLQIVENRATDSPLHLTPINFSSPLSRLSSLLASFHLSNSLISPRLQCPSMFVLFLILPLHLHVPLPSLCQSCPFVCVLAMPVCLRV